MPIEYRKNLAVLSEVIAVEEAEALLGWVQGRREPRADLGACSHLHTAALQVLMAAQVRVTAWPADPDLARWLRSALHDRHGPPG